MVLLWIIWQSKINKNSLVKYPKIVITALISFFIFNVNSVKAQDLEVSKKWWKEAVFYQIYMPSYSDSNGDGY